MTNKQKAAINAILGISSLAVVAMFWRSPIFLTVILFVLSAIMILTRKEKGSIVVYVIGFVFGTLAEYVAIQCGAWTYTLPTAFDVPIWLPFLWANAALFIVNTEKLFTGHTPTK